MVEDIKTLIDRLVKNIAVVISRQGDVKENRLEAIRFDDIDDNNSSNKDVITIHANKEEKIIYSTLRDLLGLAAEKAGKSKDELIKVLGQEIGMAAVALIKEPLSQLVESKKLQITIELAPKNKEN